MQDGLLQCPLADIMPTAGLCRAGVANIVNREGSLIFVARFIGIITGSPGRRARGPAAESGRV